MTSFRPYEPDQHLLLPPSLRDWLPPDHRTICRFREQHLAAFERLFVQVVQIARDTGLVRMGTLAVDGKERIIVAAAVQQSASDAPALVPMVEQANPHTIPEQSR